MASTKEYRDFILEQLSKAPDIACRPRKAFGNSKRHSRGVNKELRPAGFVVSLRSTTTPGVGSKNPKQDLGFLLTSYGVRTYGSHPAFPKSKSK